MLTHRDINATISGKNLWDSLSMDQPSIRTEILHNIDDIWGSAAVTVNDWKLIKGTNYAGQWDSWYGPAGNRSPTAYSFSDIEQSLAGKALHKLGHLPSADIVR